MIDGLDQFQADIDQITRRLTDAVDIAAATGGEEVRKEVETRAPFRTGDLKAHIVKVVQRGKNRVTATVQIDSSAKGDIRFHAVLIEHGTSKMPARPYMRPGFDVAVPRALSVMQNILRNAIED